MAVSGYVLVFLRCNFRRAAFTLAQLRLMKLILVSRKKQGLNRQNTDRDTHRKRRSGEGRGREGREGEERFTFRTFICVLAQQMFTQILR